MEMGTEVDFTTKQSEINVNNYLKILIHIVSSEKRGSGEKLGPKHAPPRAAPAGGWGPGPWPGCA